MERWDLVIVGGGVVGLATAMALLDKRPGLRMLICEKETGPGRHQSGHNSGVVHSGVYYKPGSLKARFAVEGSKRIARFCAEQQLPFEACGKVIVATDPLEQQRLLELQRRGEKNQVPGLERIGPERLRELEPHVAGLEALWVPGAAVVDFAAITERYAQLVTAQGAELRTGCRVRALTLRPEGWLLETTTGALEARFLVGCAGLHADRLARRSGEAPDLRIVPFRGEYRILKAESTHLAKGLIYPVPDPKLPFLGVHLTRSVHGEVEAGPNAVLALHREGYRRGCFSLRDSWETLRYPGFWRMAGRHWRAGIYEELRSHSKATFTRDLQRLVPEITAKDLVSGRAGVRAQALSAQGELVDDFRLVDGDHSLHVLNAPSPAATASIPIGEEIARRVELRLSED